MEGEAVLRMIQILLTVWLKVGCSPRPAVVLGVWLSYEVYCLNLQNQGSWRWATESELEGRAEWQKLNHKLDQMTIELEGKKRKYPGMKGHRPLAWEEQCCDHVQST
jgi:hypothetical protein